MTKKESIYRDFLQLARDKVAGLQRTLADLRESASNETKSTAGDKHETALAMLQIEQANVLRQLGEARDVLAVLEKLDYEQPGEVVGKGSLVTTDRGIFFLAAAVGKINTIISISPESPLGKVLIGKGVGSTVEVNKLNYRILFVE